MTDLFDTLASAPFWIAVLRIATPLILGTLGVLLCERAGVLNLGIEGIMVAGAFSGWLAVYAGAPLWVGVGVAALTGAAFGLLHAFLTVGLALSQHVSGLGITLLATSLSYFGYRVSFPKVDTPPTITPLAPMHWLDGTGLGVLAAGVFVAGVLVGADSMSRAVGVPTYIADVIVAASLISVLVATLLTQYRVRWK